VAGSLLLVPLVALTLDGQFTLPLPTLTPTALKVVDRHAQRGEAGQPALFSREADGVSWERGRRLWPFEKLCLTLKRVPGHGIIRLQADANDTYLVEAHLGGDRRVELWRARPLPSARGLATRTSPVLRLPDMAADGGLRITAQGGDSNFAVGALSLTPVVPFSLLHLGALLWLLWLCLLAVERWTPGRAMAAATLRGWARVDAPLAAALCTAALFEASLLLVAAAAAALAFWLAARLLVRKPLGALVLGVTCAALYFLVIGPVVNRVVRGNVEKLQTLDLEHRLRPHSEPDINADGLRFKGEAADMRPGDFNVLFLGDSFTFGWKLPYEQSYPAQLERLLAGRCKQRVRAVNFGWPGASPVLAHRLLRQVGASYRPDLVLYNLDMTDFRDDLLYEQNLANKGQALRPDVPALLWYAARHGLVQLLGPGPVARLQGALRGPGRATDPADAFPEARFFPLIGPLAETRPFMERGTMRHLRALHAHARDQLQVPFAVMVIPRACQYSDREAPQNWEHDCPVKGQYVKEPNRYLASVKGQLGFPLHDMLPGFERSQTFPLYLKDDPHWNAAGAALAARLTAGALIKEGLLPCDAPPAAEATP